MLKKSRIVKCDECGGDCCDGLVLEIGKPRTKEDYEDVRWYLYHEKTHVYIDMDGDWMAEMDLPCIHRSGRGGRCKIYNKRPPVCREGAHSECELNFDDVKVRFRTVREYDAWLRKRRSR